MRETHPTESWQQEIRNQQDVLEDYIFYRRVLHALEGQRWDEYGELLPLREYPRPYLDGLPELEGAALADELRRRITILEPLLPGARSPLTKGWRGKRRVSRRLRLRRAQAHTARSRDLVLTSFHA